MNEDAGRTDDVGFVAFWDRTPAEFVARTQDERETTERIQAAFRNGRARGIQMFGLYNIRWCSSFAYMTFWHSPDVSAVTATIRDLEAAGDFKFATSLHVLGTRVRESPFQSPAAKRRPWPTLTPGAEVPMALWVRWSRDGGGSGGWPRPEETRALVAAQGVWCWGEYASSWVVDGDRFCVLVAPSIAAGLTVRRHLGDIADRCRLRLQITLGALEEFYRFGRSLQLDDGWARKERLS